MAINSNLFLVKIYPRLLISGSKLCHQQDGRSFHFGIRKYPVCARCTGIYVGQLIGIVLYFTYVPSLYLCLAIAIPMIVDGFTQLRTSYESTNNRRLITGLLFGYAITTIAIYCIIEIANKF